MAGEQPIVAFLYDFDRTLCTTDMQDYAFIPSLGMTPAEFWAEANEFGRKHRMRVYREETGDDTPPRVIGGGTYARAMKNIVAYGPLLPGREETEHQKDEYLALDDLLKAEEIYRSALQALANGG